METRLIPCCGTLVFRYCGRHSITILRAAFPSFVRQRPKASTYREPGPLVGSSSIGSGYLHRPSDPTMVLCSCRSLSGKTTLVKEFLHAGADYFSDEFAVLDASGRVHPFARPLSMRTDQSQSQGRMRITAGELGAEAGSEPLPVALVVLTQYKPGAHWRPRVLSSGKGILGLLANAIAARTQPERALATLERMIRRAQVLESARGAANEVVESLGQKNDSLVIHNHTCYRY